MVIFLIDKIAESIIFVHQVLIPHAVCGEGTAWDPIKKNCGWENTVECKKGLRRWDQITDIRGGKVMYSDEQYEYRSISANLVTMFATDAALGMASKKEIYNHYASTNQSRLEFYM